MQIYKVKQFNPKYRILEATSDIKEGQLIMKLNPIAHAVISSMRLKICSFCLKQKQQLNRCSKCKVMFYCNKECQLLDWTIHKLECKGYEAVTNKKFKLTSEFILLTRVYLATKNDTSVKQQISKFLELPEYQPENVRQYFTQMASVFIQNFGLQKSTQTMGELIRLLGIISVNTFTIQDYLFNYQGIAIGLYCPANFINHSCNPNSVQVFNGKELNIISLRNIQPEEQITISYIDQTLDIVQRNRKLKEAYYFDCSCFQCLAEKAVKRDFIDLLCTKCEQGNVTFINNGYCCNSCSHNYSLDDIDHQKQEIVKYKKILQQQRPYQQTIKSFYAIKKLLRFTNSYFSKVIQLLYHQALQKAQLSNIDRYYEDAYRIMKTYIQYFPYWYHMADNQKFHILLIWKYAEIGKLAMYLKKVKKAVEYTEKAIQILQKSQLSLDFPEVRDLKKRYDQLQIQCRMNATSRNK